MATHTMGPWKGDLNADSDQFGIYPDTGKMEFPIAIMPDFVKAETNAANARLIAAAPDLLKQLRQARGQVIGFMLECGYSVEVAERNVAEIDAAIARATGEQP